MKKILLAICFVSAVLASCSKVGPTSLSAIPSELHWDSDETKAQKVTVSSNYVWYAYLDDEVNWILSISSDGRTFTVAPRTENKTVDTLYAKIAVVSRELMQFIVCTQY